VLHKEAGETSLTTSTSRRSQRWRPLLLAGMTMVPFMSGASVAETLRDALSAAYGYNPRLDAQRAFQRASDEDVARAMSGYRPTVTARADIGIERTDQRPSSAFDGVTTPRGYSVQAVQPLFRGFRTYNAVNEAEANVRAQREVLRDVERNVLLQAVTAYMDVVRDQELVRLNENNVNVLSRELKAAQDRFAIGDVGHAHRRRPGGGAAGRCRIAPRCCARQSAHQPRKLSAGHRPCTQRPDVAGSTRRVFAAPDA